MTQHRNFNIAVGIPAYGRVNELKELLDSILQQTVIPQEVTICEDMSAERPTIREIVREWAPKLQAMGATVTYIENEINLGYDGNVRNVISSSHTPWVMLMGNDDLLLPTCIEEIQAYLSRNDSMPVISRSFVRFDTDINTPLGVSKISSVDTVFRNGISLPKMIFRSCGFVGGLVIDRQWAHEFATKDYDGTLYYQIYLAAEAFCTKGIGYIGEPTVAGRANNPPLFGSAATEKDVHIPGSYTPKARSKMWASVLRIATDVGQRHHVDLLTDIRAELEVRQSFHVFEMMAGQPAPALREMRDLLQGLGLFTHPVPRLLYWINRSMGRYARLFYWSTRRVLQ